MTTRLQIPTVTTDRLRLVPPSEVHIPGETAFWGDAERSRFAGGPIPAHRIWRHVATNLGHWALRGYGFWALELHDGTHVGMAGLWHPGEWPEAEIGYNLYDGFGGKGYATEAAVAARAHAFDKLGFERIASFIHPDNIASQAVARRIGGTRSGRTFRPNPDDTPVEIWHYERSRP
ncbi:GNAT family N-acetyltransferase [Profundibacterium mesophilum]|uniref:UDP-N-acetylmuramoylalanine--D-glutamate ligase n=1 Tax=Profundibacterium mesophilum KAUST100406-0324 TaxID=1037889 RepID=A0A921TCC1_9RHOB|nr:GNAT family N-acetyltransferase [Profundibacterium mesophilum]KAF0676920.1 UDP-N-acetylmuramoylalanine--D-glutamate ligase [Profundibacterium mesophilum KAUST100406-0324]